MKKLFIIILALSLSISLNIGFANASTTETAKLTADNGGIWERFGHSVAISGDTAVVGAWGDDNWKGSAYVFVRTDGIWKQQAQLTASNGVTGDRFGYSAAISGDTIVVGAWGNDGCTGWAYVFEKPTNGWVDMTETANLTASDGAASDWFGHSVAISGNTIIVGAQGNDECKGRAYVFEKPTMGWVDMAETANLTASDGMAGDHFGVSVAINEETIVVGAQGDDDWKGSAYVFEKPTTGWVNMTETAKLTASGGAASDWFGYSVAISVDTTVVGAYAGDNIGSAYVFEKPTTGWVNMTETANLTASDIVAGDKFGYSVAISENIAVVGAFGNDDKGDLSGSAYVFKKPNTGWVNMTETANLTASDGMAEDRFGISVAISGDTTIVGAAGNNNWTGSVYIYQLVPKPEVMVKNLCNNIETIGELPESIENGLLAALDRVMKAINDSKTSNDITAINNLEAFINKIQAQRDKKIDDEYADELIADAQDIIAILSRGT